MTAPDFPLLAAQAAPILAPYLPYIIKGLKLAGQEVFKKTGEMLTETGYKRAEKLWEKLRPQVEQQPLAASVVTAMAEHPDDPGANEMLITALQQVLRALPAQELTAIQNIVNESSSTTNTVTASGSRSVAIGGNANNSTIITGNSNKLGGKE
jgi:hypothetical protein